MVTEAKFRARNRRVLTEAQSAVNVGFGAILSAYVGNSLAEIDNHPFDHHALARFFLLVAAFILCLCVGNSVILRGEYKLGAGFLLAAGIVAFFAYGEGKLLGFEVVILRLLTGCWAIALLGSDAVLTLINYIHHRDAK